jgi:hypothetical protein
MYKPIVQDSKRFKRSRDGQVLVLYESTLSIEHYHYNKVETFQSGNSYILAALPFSIASLCALLLMNLFAQEKTF